MKQLYNTALYMRLSRDDENYGDSVSIEPQRTILQQYAKEQELHVVGEFVDDGWSWTMFDRPNFKRMIDDVGIGPNNHYHIQLIPLYSFEKRGSGNFVKQRTAYIFDEQKFMKLKEAIWDYATKNEG